MTRTKLILSVACALLVLLVTGWHQSAEAAPCGNGKCQPSESCASCPADCGVCPTVCGDATCDADEDCSTCPGDCGSCPSVCGDGTCEGLEDCSTCSTDCGACSYCGDSFCASDESCSTCTADCGVCSECGNGVCAAPETCAICPADCGACPTCGDGMCSPAAGEDCGTCQTDCGVCACGDGTCDSSEDCASCASDCGTCSVGNDFASCSPDLVACTDSVTNCCYRDFAASSGPGAIIIPMDRCHQAPGNGGGPIFGNPRASKAWCSDPSGGDDGMFLAYGLIYRLMQQGIPVHWVINPTKDPPALTIDETPVANQTYNDRDIDFWVVSPGVSKPLKLNQSLNNCGGGCTPPVLRLNPTTLAAVAGTYTKKEIPFRGAAFVIAPEDRARFDDFWKRQGEFAKFAGNALYDFSQVDLFEVQPGAQFMYSDFRSPGPDYTVFNGGASAPVFFTLDYDPPKLGRHAPAAVSTLWLNKVQLNEPAAYPACLTGPFSPSTAVYCNFTDADIQAGYLVNGDFTWLWTDNWENHPAGGPCSNGASQTQMDKMIEFMTAVPGVRSGGHILFIEDSVKAAENCPGFEPLGVTGTGLAHYSTRIEEPLIIRYPTNVFVQWGDLPTGFAEPDGGSAGFWAWYTDGSDGASKASDGYQPLTTLTRLITQETTTSPGTNPLCNNHISTPDCDNTTLSMNADRLDVAVYARYQDVYENGLVFYMGGRNVFPATNAAQLRMLSNSFLAIPAATVPVASPSAITTEKSRSAPIVATIDAVEIVFQGSFDTYDPAPDVTSFPTDGDNFRFPYTTGHLRAIDSADLQETETDFTEITPIFDAADGIPPAAPDGCGAPFSNTCRTVFTNAVAGSKPDRISFDRSNTSVLTSLLGEGQLTDAQTSTLIGRILAGQGADVASLAPALGGIDRSTVAVIGTSPQAEGADTRPVMAYAAGLDGMLHAFCVEAVDPCTTEGQELWAFIPRTQLPYLRFNTQRFDGSPKVADVFGDFDGDGDSEWRTILTIQTGSGVVGNVGRSPATFALDITQPDDPIILWERATPATRDDFEIGSGLTLSMGPVRDGVQVKNLTFIHTNNGGTGPPGIVVTAVDTVTGEIAWTFGHDYSNARTSGNPPVPSTAIPGGVAAVDMKDNGSISHLVAPDLYGQVWLIDAKTGTSSYGTDSDGEPIPLFRFTTDYKPIGAPPTIYRHPTNGKLHTIIGSGGYADPVETTWVDDSEQFVIGMSIEAPSTAVPITEASSDTFGGNRHLRIPLGFDADGNPNRVFSAATVAGGEVFIVTDSTDVNLDTFGTPGGKGLLQRFSLTTDADGNAVSKGSTVLSGGAASVDASSGTVYTGSGQSGSKITLDDFEATGDAAELTFSVSKGRLLYLRTR